MEMAASPRRERVAARAVFRSAIAVSSACGRGFPLQGIFITGMLPRRWLSKVEWHKSAASLRRGCR